VQVLFKDCDDSELNGSSFLTCQQIPHLICPAGVPAKNLSSAAGKKISLHSLLETSLWIPPSRPT
jgi:hypothetical protein